MRTRIGVLLLIAAACADDSEFLEEVPPTEQLPPCDEVRAAPGWRRAAEDVRSMTIGRCGDLAYRSADDIFLLDRDLVTLTELGVSTVDPVFAPSGRTLVYSIEDQLHVRTLATSEERITTLPKAAGMLGVAWTPSAEVPWATTRGDDLVRIDDQVSILDETVSVFAAAQRGSTVVYRKEQRVWVADVVGARIEEVTGLDPWLQPGSEEMRKDDLYLTRDGRVLAQQSVWYVPCGDTFCRDRESPSRFVDLGENRIIGEVTVTIEGDFDAPAGIIESHASGHTLLLRNIGSTDLLRHDLRVESLGSYVPFHLFSDLRRALVHDRDRALSIDLSNRSETLLAEGRGIERMKLSADENTIVVPHWTDRCIRSPETSVCHTQITAAEVRSRDRSHTLFATQPISPRWADGDGRVLAMGQFLFGAISEVADPMTPKFQTCLFDPAGAPRRCWEHAVEHAIDLGTRRIAIVVSEYERGPHAVRLDVVDRDSGESETLLSAAGGMEIFTDPSTTRLFARTNIHDYALPDEVWIGAFTE